eukprot:11516157-Karenia_brevis.AAC.2
MGLSKRRRAENVETDKKIFREFVEGLGGGSEENTQPIRLSQTSGRHGLPSWIQAVLATPSGARKLVPDTMSV